MTFKPARFLFVLIICFASLLAMTQPTLADFYSTTMIPNSHQNLGTPREMLYLADGSLWFVDSQNYRIVKINAAGQIVRTVGRQGNGEGEFAELVVAITQDDDGYLYVVDLNHIYKLDFNGGYMDSWRISGDGFPVETEVAVPNTIHYSSYHQTLFLTDEINHRVTQYDTSGNYISSFGENGTGNGQFDNPFGLTTDDSGQIYVVDCNNHRVQMFNPAGEFIRTFGHNIELFPDDYGLLFPKDVEVLSNGEIVVSSQNSQHIRFFNQAGEFVRVWGEHGSGDHQFFHPQYLVKTATDTIFVSDWAQKRIQNFDANGNLIKVYGGNRTAEGNFSYPLAVDVGTDFWHLDHVFVLDGTGRVQEFNENGVYIDTIIEAGTLGNSVYHLTVSSGGYLAISADTHVSIFDLDGNYINKLGTAGNNGPNSGPGDFDQARGMVFDDEGYFYVADMVNARIQKFSLEYIEDPDFNTTYSGGFVSQWAAFNNVEHLFLHQNTDLYAAAGEAHEGHLYVRIYDTSGVLQSTFLDGFGEGPEQYYVVGGIFIGEDEYGEGTFYLADRYYNRIQTYDLTAQYLGSIGSAGSGYEQFDEPTRLRVHPTTGDLIVVDTNNHRLHMMKDGVKIINLIDSAEVLDANNSLSLTRRSLNPGEDSVDNISAELYFGDYVVSDFNVNLTEERDWAPVNAIALPEESKALVVNLDPTGAPGISETHAIYVVKQSDQQSVMVCPEAALIGDLTPECTNGYILEEGDAQLTIVPIGGIDYWRVAGLTGTGVLGLPGEEGGGDDGEEEGGDTVLADSSISNQSRSSSSSSTSVCHGPAPSSASDLFQIDVTSDTAKLFFTPIGNTSDFQISFSTNPDAEMHGEMVTLLREGVQSHTVYFLKPNTTYYYKVRGQLGCMPGEWSNIMSATTRRAGITSYLPYYKNFVRSKIASVWPITNMAKLLTTPVIEPSTTASDSTEKSNPAVQEESQRKVDNPSTKKQFCIFRWCW